MHTRVFATALLRPLSLFVQHSYHLPIASQRCLCTTGLPIGTDRHQQTNTRRFSPWQPCGTLTAAQLLTCVVWHAHALTGTLSAHTHTQHTHTIYGSLTRTLSPRFDPPFPPPSAHPRCCARSPPVPELGPGRHTAGDRRRFLDPGNRDGLRPGARHAAPDHGRLLWWIRGSVLDVVCVSAPVRQRWHCVSFVWVGCGREVIHVRFLCVVLCFF